MAITAAYGFKPVQLLGGLPFSGGTIREFAVTPAAATNPMGNGDLVNITAGVATTIAAAPAAGTLSANTPVGVCVGVRFVDPVLKQSQHANFLPANSVGYTSIFALVVDGPDVLYQIRYNGVLTSANIGNNTSVTFVAASTTNGAAQSYASGAALTATLPFRIIDVIGGDGVNYTDIIVRYNWQTQAYAFPTGQ